MKLIAVQEIAALLSSTRETVVKKLSSLVPTPGKHRAKLYPSDQAIKLVLGLGEAKDGGEFIDYAEAQRLLTVKRGEQIDLEMEVTRRQRIPLDVLDAINETAFSNVVGMLKAHEGKLLTAAAIGDMLGELREIGARVKEAAK